MKKAFVYTIVIALIGFIGYIIYQMTTFSLFDIELKKVVEIRVPNKPYTLHLYYLSGNATAREYIQVRQQLDNNTETILQNYEGFNFVNSYEIIDDTTLQLVLSYSQKDFNDGKADTILFKIP